MNSIDTFLAPDTLQGPYTDFYKRAFAELFCWRMLRDGDDSIVTFAEGEIEMASLESLGLQLGTA
jgi:hypothetical protein